MERKYVRVTPSREEINPEDIVNNIGALQEMRDRRNKQSLLSKFNPFDDRRNVPKFSLLVTLQGKDSPIELLYSCDEGYIDSLYDRLTTAYPPSFDIDVVTIDPIRRLIEPQEYSAEDFAKKYQDGSLLYNEDITGTKEDIKTGGKANQKEKDVDSEIDEKTRDKAKEAAKNLTQDQRTDGGTTVDTNDDDAIIDNHQPVDRPSETTKPNPETEVVTETGRKEYGEIKKEQKEGMSLLEEIDPDLLEHVEMLDEDDADDLKHEIDGPTWTQDGNILARPSLEDVDPIGVQWNGRGERKQDWMTTMKLFNKDMKQSTNENERKAPLAALIQSLSRLDVPVAFQVVFKSMDDWTEQARERKRNIHLRRDTRYQKLRYEINQLMHGQSSERRDEQRRDYVDRIGESTDRKTESPAVGDVGRRRKLIDNKLPKDTFRANIRAVSLAPQDMDNRRVVEEMQKVSSVFDHVGGYFYGVEAKIIEDEDGLLSNKNATELFHRVVNREINTGSGKVRPDLVLNPDELANFIAVPSAKNLTTEGVRGTRAEDESRDPLPRPDPGIMRHFHKPGMRVGYALDKEHDTEPVATQIPPKLLNKHFGRFGTTGSGKSVALINDILSLYENTSGPTILIDQKGDGMADNYLRAHYERFGQEDLEENVIYFPIPNVLPGFSFFNIEREVDDRVEKDEHNRPKEEIRNDVIQNRADYFEELLKLVMGIEEYSDSKVAPILIKSFIKILYDKEYTQTKIDNGKRGEENSILTDRDDENKFKHQHLVELASDIQSGTGINEDNVKEYNKPIRDAIQEQMDGDEHTFAAIMNAVFNRLNYIREDQHLRKIFNNTDPQFDFRDHLNDDVVIIFDLGGVRDQSSVLLSGLIMTELWDSVQTSPMTKCVEDHESRSECRREAREKGLDEVNPPCREDWERDHLINLVIDEAASVTASNILSKMLEQGRSFHLSLGLSMQFPEQMKDSSQRVYKNVLNNIGTKLISKISLDEEIAKAMANERVDVKEFNNRIRTLPRGEWIIQPPSPQFMETGPLPFSLKPLPIPAGHEDAEHVLDEDAEQRFMHTKRNILFPKVKQEYSINETLGSVSGVESQSEEDTDAEQTNSSNKDEPDVKSNGISDLSNTSNEETTDPTDETDDSDIPLGDYNIPDINNEDPTDETNETRDSTTQAETQQADTKTLTDALDETDTNQKEKIDKQQQDTTNKNTDTTTKETQSNDNDVNVLEQIQGDASGAKDNLPGYVTWDDEFYTYQCKICNSEYIRSNRHEAINCCKDIVQEARKNITDPTTVQDIEKESSQTRSTITPRNARITIIKNESDTTTKITPDVESISSLSDIPKAITTHKDTIGAVASRIATVIPPEHTKECDQILDWMLTGLHENVGANNIEGIDNLSKDSFRTLIHRTPPADIEISVIDLLKDVTDNIDVDAVERWNQDNNELIGRFVSQPYSRTNYHKGVLSQSDYIQTYNQQLHKQIEPTIQNPTVFSFAGIDNMVKTSQENTDDITEQHQEKYNITDDEAKFMRAVVKAANRELSGYTLDQSMRSIRDQYGNVDINKLVNNGYIKKHTGVDQRIYYTVTSKGQRACRTTQKHGNRIGDIGAETPHKVGIELIKRYYEQQERVDRIDITPTIDSVDIDLAVYDQNDSLIATVEVEAGQVEADKANNAQHDIGINDYTSIREDYKKLARLPGQSIWVVRNVEILEVVLRSLSTDSQININPPDGVFNRLQEGQLQMFYDTYLNEIQSPGLDNIMTYKRLRNKIQ